MLNYLLFAICKKEVKNMSNHVSVNFNENDITFANFNENDITFATYMRVLIDGNIFFQRLYSNKF